ncbi:hypothetical protein ABPG72_006587 [Tetrahymena utriculariae]
MSFYSPTANFQQNYQNDLSTTQQYQNFAMTELYQQSKSEQQFNSDMDVIGRAVSDLSNRLASGQINYNTLDLSKQLLNERNNLQERTRQYYRNMKEFLDVLNDRSGNYSSYDTHGTFQTFKNLREKLQMDRGIIMAKLFQFTNPLAQANNMSRNTSLSNIGKNVLSNSMLSNDVSRLYDKNVSKQILMPNGGVLDRSSMLYSTQGSTRIEPNASISLTNPDKSVLSLFNNSINDSLQNATNVSKLQSQSQLQLPPDNSIVKSYSEQINKSYKQGQDIADEIKMGFAGLDPALINGNQSQLTKVFRSILPEGEKEIEKMSEEEKKYINLITKVGDAQRFFKKIPENSPLYYQKLQEINMLTNLKNDVEKIVQEQKYQRAREDYEKSGKPDPERERQLKIRGGLIQRLNNLHGSRKYHPFEGFTIFWDWVVNLPKKYDSCKLQWGLFKKSEVIVSPKYIEERQAIAMNFNSKQVVWGDRDHVYDIKAHKDILLVVELQCYFKDLSSKQSMDVYGWSILELFDLNLDLMRGKWKIPFYSTKINPNVLVSQVKRLQSQSNTMLHLRICFPQDLEFGDEYPLHPLSQGNEFFLPVIHKKTLIQPSIEWDLTKSLQTSEMFNRKDESSDEDSEISEDADANFGRDEIGPQKPEVEEWKPKPYPDNRRGLHVTIHNLLRYLKDRRSKVRCYLIDIKRGTIKDDMGDECMFETDVYAPSKKPKLKQGEESLVDQMEESILIQEGITAIEEDYHFFVDIETYAYNNKAYEDVYLLFQVYSDKYQQIDSDDEDNQEDIDANTKLIVDETGKTIKVRTDGTEIDKNGEKKKKKGVLQGKSWYAFPLFEGERANLGHYIKQLYDLPIQRPPFNMQAVNFFDNSEIDFSINFFGYTKDNMRNLKQKYQDLRDFKKQQRKKPKPPKKKKVVVKEELDDLSKAFLENLERQYHDRPFEKGYGIDFYVDAARFLPDNVTICKISVTIINHNFERVFESDAALPDLLSDAFSPKFSFRKELRATHFDPTLQAFMTVETIDNMNKEVRIVGYSIINFFLNQKTKKQPTNQLDTDIILQDGNYQIPIFCQHPPKIKPFNVERLSQLDKLPCASLLVRIRLAPMSEDGLRALTLDDIQKQDWEKIGLWVPAPPYSIERQSFYNTSYYNLRDSEKELFVIRLNRQSPPQVELLNIIVNAVAQKTKQERIAQAEKLKSKIKPTEQDLERGIVTKVDNVGEAKQWIDKNIIRDPYTDIIELQYFAKYKPDAGFKFSLDGFHNNPQTDYPIIGLFCLNPPGDLYKNLGAKTDTVILDSAFNWDSPIISPQFNEGYFTFRGIDYSKNLSIIIDCRKVKFSERGDKVVIENVGWTICPIFTPNGYVKSGIYQIPMFKGSIPMHVVDSVTRQDPWEYIEEQLKTPKSGVVYYENMSAIIRLLDAQRDGHYQVPFDHTRIIYKYIPKNRLGSYAYNAAVEVKLQKAKKLMSLVPNKAKVNEYQEKLTQSVIKSLGLK